MQTDWNKMTTEERAEFAVWREEKQAAADAKARAEAAAAAEPKLYKDMTLAEQVAFKRRHRLPLSRVAGQA